VVSQTPADEIRLPQILRAEVGATRREEVHLRPIGVDADWWNNRLRTYGLPGGPLTTHDGALNRRDIFAVAAGSTESTEGALTLLWHALAWGAGRYRRLCDARLRAIADNPKAAGELLSHAAETARLDPASAYRLLLPDGHTALPYLGPPFFTKFLYFAGCGDPAHASAILDSRVASTLRQLCGWRSLTGRYRWPAETYGRYCSMLRTWATDLARGGDSVSIDQIEYVLFANSPSMAAATTNQTG
jgi:hypothetical protein